MDDTTIAVYIKNVKGRFFAFRALDNIPVQPTNGTNGWKAKNNLVRNLQDAGYAVLVKVPTAWA